MTYDMLPPNSSGDDHVDGIEHEVQHRSRYHPIKHYEEIKILLQIYSAFAITLLCVLLFMNLLVWQGKPPNRDNDDAIQSTYARDKRFMTLDPMYDQLWDSMFPDGHLEIMLPDEELGGEVPATISMYVCYKLLFEEYCMDLAFVCRAPAEILTLRLSGSTNSTACPLCVVHFKTRTMERI